MTITRAVITYTTRAPKCKAQGCNRRTKAPHGFCWQHADMAKYQEYEKARTALETEK